MSFLTTRDDVRLRLCTRGRGGRPIVLVHGWKMSHRVFDHAILRLAPEHGVVAFDLRGMGESDKPDSRLLVPGEIPSPTSPPHGCPFHPRCPYAEAVCREGAAPPIVRVDETRTSACHFAARVHEDALRGVVSPARATAGQP